MQTIYQVRNSTVKEINANVCAATFEGKKGVQLADLYYSSNSCPSLVYHNSCPPVNDTFIKTVLINL